jgi:hypothetical protein
MDVFLDKPIPDRTPEPLHQALLTLGRHWLPWMGGKSKEPRLRVRHARVDGRYDLGTMLLTERNQEITVKQLATSLRMRGIDDESAAMLDLLESLILAGEISFHDYMSRVQHLFPHVLDQVDASLRVKISALMVA